MSTGSELVVDILVVGGGVIGAAITYHLARSGAGTVAVCEQGRFPGEGASTRSAGLLRMHHTSHCQTRLAARSLPTFRNWPEEIGGDCGYQPVGFLMLVGPDRAAHLTQNSKAVGAANGDSELLTSAEVSARWPHLRTGDVAAACFEAAGGYADPAVATSSLLAAARRCGARRWEGVRVSSLRTTGERVVGAETNLGPVSAGTVVLAAGAWSAPLARPAGVELPITARRIGLAWAHLPDHPGATTPLPACIDDVAGCYFRSDDDGLYFGVPARPQVTPDGPVDPLSRDELTTARQAVTTRVPALATAPVVGTRAGFDGYTPDRHAVIGPAGPGGLYIAAGFSGGGFKVAPAVGELVASELSGGPRQPLLDPYRLGRFAAGQPIALDYPYAHS